MKIIYRNKKIFKLLILLIIILIIVCSVFPPRWLLVATQRSCYKKNPLSYEFSISKDSLMKIIPKDGSVVNFYRFRDAYVYINNESEIVASLSHSYPKIYDYTYRKIGGKRRLNFKLYFSIAPITSEKCKVTFLSEKSEYKVSWGKNFYFGVHGDMGFEDLWLDIPPSDILVSEVLKFIGSEVGEKNMSPISYPISLSRKYILETFGTDNPFTPQEQFGDKE